jgi:exodeoxyribonuclease V alpha subunit
MSDTRYGEKALAEALGKRLSAWARASGAAEASIKPLEIATRRLSEATSSGHVCLTLDVLTSGNDAWTPTGLRTALLASGVVGLAESPGAMPLVLDSGNRLYLHRDHDLEVRLARRLARAAHEPLRPVDAHLREVFTRFHSPDGVPPAEFERMRGQRLAAALALLRPLVIVSGGPGTGKTTTVARLLACLLAVNPHERIALAAPTGKAAARMEESLRKRSLDLRAQTIHRLLGATRDPGVFRHHRGNPLPIDTLVVDEASMLDLALATRLLEAVPEGARIILLGDREQLASVEAGAVFAELSTEARYGEACREALLTLDATLAGTLAPVPEAAEPSGTTHALSDAVVLLTEGFRFGQQSGPGRMAACIRQDDADGLIAAMLDPGLPGAEWIDNAEPTLNAALLGRMLAGLEPCLQAIANPESQPADLMKALEAFRVLCALREGPRGVQAVNTAISTAIRRRRLHAADPGEPSPWYPGRPVIVQRNDYALGLYNGDTGIAWPDDDGELQVWFPAGDDGLWRSIPPARLPEHETAWALTVHKSQGSEFDAVMVLLPGDEHALLSRELIYTAVTRAREHASLAGSREAIAQAVRQPARRMSGLAARLDETAHG